jgi:hypothetical protein
MKALTHYVFSIGMGVLVSERLGYFSFIDVVLVVWLGLAVNVVIDVFGHGLRGGVGNRSFLTHSVFTAPVWGGAVAVLSVYVPVRFQVLPIGLWEAVFIVVMGVLIAYSHLFLDALTEGGVYWGRRRVALAHMRYNNRILNAVFLLIGAFFAVAAVLPIS